MINWLRTWWLSVPEPREQSIAWGFVYLALAFTGFVTMWNPPMTLHVAFGQEALYLFSTMLVIGVLMAMGGGWLEFWKLERLGLIAMAGGLSLYAAVVLTLHFSSEGSRLTQFGVIMALIAALGARYLLIWRFSFRPRIDSPRG